MDFQHPQGYDQMETYVPCLAIPTNHEKTPKSCIDRPSHKTGGQVIPDSFYFPKTKWFGKRRLTESSWGKPRTVDGSTLSIAETLKSGCKPGMLALRSLPAWPKRSLCQWVTQSFAKMTHGHICVNVNQRFDIANTVWAKDVCQPSGRSDFPNIAENAVANFKNIQHFIFNPLKQKGHMEILAYFD